MLVGAGVALGVAGVFVLSVGSALAAVMPGAGPATDVPR